MFHKRYVLLTVLAALLVFVGAPVMAQPAGGGDGYLSVLYHGDIQSGFGAFSGECDFTFSLFGTPTGGTALASQESNNIAVNAGAFEVMVEFDERFFRGTPGYMEITAECDNEIKTLPPRVELVPNRQQNGLVVVPQPPSATGANWLTTGNAGVVSGTNFLGTTDIRTLEMRVNNQTAFRIIPVLSSEKLDPLPANIVGGSDNTMGTEDTYASVISGGTDNHIEESVSGTIAGGMYNSVTANAGVISGGRYNSAFGHSTVIAGGSSNTASGEYSTVGGGLSNKARGDHSTIPGGALNEAAGSYSFAAGFRAKVLQGHNGAFVWGDSTDADVSSSAANSFTVRATGGINLRTNASLTTGCNLAVGGGTWNCTSDRNAKEAFSEIDPRAVLESVAEMPITSWQFKGTDERHIGPVAQDFYAAFGLGEGEITISAVDADGVALAAIQGLYGVVQEKDSHIQTLETRLASMESLLLLAVAGVVIGFGMVMIRSKRRYAA